MNSYKCYWKQDGKLCSMQADDSDTPKHAVWAVRQAILGEKAKFFEVKQAVMAVVK